MLVAGGGATNAVCLHRARAAGLGGFEFACAIPGTAGGGVWMNAGAYGSDWSAILIRALVATAGRSGLAHAGRARASPTGTRASATARSSPRSSTGSSPRDESEIRADGPRPRRSAQGDAADDEAHVRLGVQEPAGRARRGSDARAVRPQGLPDRRRAHLAEARELHRERRRRDDGRLPRADGRGPSPGARAVRRRARARGRAARETSRST